MLRFILSFLLVVLPALPQGNRPVHVTTTALQSSLTIPSVIEGGTANTTVYVTMIVIANTDTSSHTISITDCTTGTAFSLFTNAPIAASTTWILPLAGGSGGGIRFDSCFKWSANSTTVMGSMVGTR